MVNAERKDYLQRKLAAEQFPRKIDVQNDLESHTMVQHPNPEVRETQWRQNAERNLNFDPEYHYEVCMTLDLRQENPQWNVETVEEQMQTAKGGYEGLLEKY